MVPRSRGEEPNPDSFIDDDRVIRFREPDEGRDQVASKAKLNDDQFDAVIRLIRLLNPKDLAVVRSSTYNALKRVGVRRDQTKAISDSNPGSLKVDVRSLLNWIRLIRRSDEEAIEQLVMVDATTCVG